MAKMIKTEPKICEICNILFHRKPTYPIKQWSLQRTCSGKCRSILLKQMNVGFKKGHPSYSEKGRFIKGQTPYNKGKKGLHISPFKGIPNGRIPHNKGKQTPEETRQKIRNKRALQTNIASGQNHWNWKGGLSELRKQVQQTYLYKNWRKSIFERDNYICQICSQRGGKLHADHKKSYSRIISENNITTVEQAKKCLELWDINNGRTLCISCHMKTDTYGGKSIKKFSN